MLALVRRARGGERLALCRRALIYDPVSQQLLLRHQPLKLTLREHALLRALVQHSGEFCPSATSWSACLPTRPTCSPKPWKCWYTACASAWRAAACASAPCAAWATMLEPDSATPDNAMNRYPCWSLRRTLLVVLLPGLLAVMGLEIAVSWRNALAAANAAFDRSLLGAIKAMDANISTASGAGRGNCPTACSSSSSSPPTAGCSTAWPAATAWWKSATPNCPTRSCPGGRPAPVPRRRLLRHPVRVGSYARRLERLLSQGSLSDRVVIQVAETLHSRQDFTRRLVGNRGA